MAQALSSAAPGATYSPAASVAARVLSVDVIRGAVMVLMAIDHVRVYAGVPAGGPTPGVFFTRWVTHFCAPLFVFLAGTSAYMLGLSLNDRRALSKYLVTRGLLLVALELTVIRASWTFSLDYSTFILAGVIWMLGWCMVLMAGLVFLSTRTIAIVGLALILLQQLLGAGLGAIKDVSGPLAVVWQFLYLGGEVQLGANGPGVWILYVIVPWIGVMAAGYAFGAVLRMEPDRRDKLCLRIGGAATVAFILLAFAVTAMDTSDEPGPPFILRMLNQQKYPASQLFLMMTIGPAILAIPWIERASGWFASMLETFGRVPMFYYLLHIPLIHAISLVVMRMRGATGMSQWYATAPGAQVPPEQRWSLLLLYGVFVVAVALLYVACRWYARLKSERRAAWMRYV